MSEVQEIVVNEVKPLSNNPRDIFSFYYYSFDYAQGDLEIHKNYFTWVKAKGFLKNLTVEDINKSIDPDKVKPPKHHKVMPKPEGDAFRSKVILRNALSEDTSSLDIEQFEVDLLNEMLERDKRSIFFKRDRKEGRVESEEYDTRKDPYGSVIRRTIINSISQDDPRNVSSVHKAFSERMLAIIENYSKMAEKLKDYKHPSEGLVEDPDLLREFVDSDIKDKNYATTVLNLASLAHEWESFHPGKNFFEKD